jgi:MFS family permease
MIFAAITRSLIGPSFNAFIAEQSAEKNRARVFGITDTLFMIISVVGPPLGGYLVDNYGFRIMLVVAWVFYIGATIIRVGMARIASHGHEANPQRLSLGNLRTNLGAMFGLLLSGGDYLGAHHGWSEELPFNSPTTLPYTGRNWWDDLPANRMAG